MSPNNIQVGKLPISKKIELTKIQPVVLCASNHIGDKKIIVILNQGVCQGVSTICEFYCESQRFVLLLSYSRNLKFTYVDAFLRATFVPDNDELTCLVTVIVDTFLLCVQCTG